MRVPKFSRMVTIPTIFVLNFLAWLYIYDDYLVSWVVVYPLFMIVVIAFTITAELAFGRDRQFKYIGLNVCVILLLTILAQRFFPMDKVELNLRENHLGHIKADVTELTPFDKAVRNKGFSIVVRDYDEPTLEVHKKGELIEKITIAQAVTKVQELVSLENKAEYNTILYNDVHYVGLRKKGGNLLLVFTKGDVNFTYELAANEQGFIWEAERYKIGEIVLP